MAMPLLIERLIRQAATQPARPALAGTHRLDSRQLVQAVTQTAAAMQTLPAGPLAFLIDNGIDWLVTDLACLYSGRMALPLPDFFLPAQISHALHSAGCNTLLSDHPLPLPAVSVQPWPGNTNQPLHCLHFDNRPVQLPAGTAKITFTSGSTGTPKGVCLAQKTLDHTAQVLNARMGHEAGGRHLCALPLAVLLENVAGAYRSLFTDGICLLYPLAELGLAGASRFDAARFHQQLQRSDSNTVILLPSMLGALVALGQSAPDSLRFVAVGGAPLPVETLHAAQRLGYPVFEGYGMSECGSVVSLNAPAAHRPGSVGRVLDHRHLQLAADGEILIHGAAALGYTGSTDALPPPIASGDIGHLDADGFLYIDGRKGNRLVTAFGRNVSPEWVETRLLAQPGIQQCLVTGHGQTALGALIVGADARAIAAAVAAANRQLPDYARIQHWRQIHEPWSAANGCLTANGRLRRAAIEQHCQTAMDQLFQSPSEVTQ